VSVDVDDVAELGMTLLMALARDVVGADAYVRRGDWRTARYRPGHLLRDRKIGIVGLGQIGRSVAKRAAAFGMEIGYHGRHEQKSQPYRYFPRLLDMAEWAEVLMLTCPGGKETFHLVDAAVLAALGADGWVVNVARGTVIDDAAMIAALEDGSLSGAGLDVFENEPEVPQALLDSSKVVLMPHQGSATVEITPYRVAHFVGAVVDHFARGASAAAE
jgi:lactate dehydrogenase-like 2-hydroxyacid dehydrogenase